MEEIPNIPEPKTKNTPTSYELDILSGMKAIVEVGGDADKAHPGHVQPDPAAGRMMPLGEIIADYPGVKKLHRSDTSTTTKPPGAKSLYRKALLIGLVLGIVTGCAVLVAFLSKSG